MPDEIKHDVRLAPTASSPGAEAGSFTVLAITLLIQAMVVAAALAPTVIAPAITSALRIADSSIGIFMALVYLSAIASTLYSGTVMSKWGAIRISQAGLLLSALGLGLLATASIPAAMAGAVLIGLGYGPITPASSHILIRTTPPHRLALVFSIKQTGVPLGGVLVGLVVPPQESAFGWQWAMLSVAGACLVMSAAAQWVRGILDVDRLAHREQSFRLDILRPISLVVSHRGLAIMAACSFIFAGVQLSLSAYLSTYLNLHLGWTLLAAGVAMSVVQVAGMAGRVFWGVVADRGLGPHKTLRLLAVVMAAGCIATALFSSGTPRFWIFTVLAVFGASAVGWNGVYLAEVARLAPAGKAGLATAGTLAFTFLGNVVWTPLFGLIANAAGSYSASYLAFCLPLLICIWFLSREQAT